ncbi:MAG: hypothetical protein ABI353_09735 [Isosphaeraceae bacterium]
MSQVRYEQAVYGSFPFWDRGYAVLAQSPGCRTEWLEELQRVCQRFGERPRGVAEPAGLFALRLKSGPWIIVGVGSPGADDRGRPDALAFHALFLGPRAARQVLWDPFALETALRRDWGPDTHSLPAGAWPVACSTAKPDDRAAPIAAALSRGRRVALEADQPIDDLARAVWQLLTPRVRRRTSVATWAFGNGNRFDLVALPKLAGVAFDASYIDAALLRAPVPTDSSRQNRRRTLAAILGAAVVVLAGAIALIVGSGDRPDRPEPSSKGTPPGSPPVRPLVVDVQPPDPTAYRDEHLGPDDPRLVAEGLADLAARFDIKAEPAANPTRLMILVADRLRYRGPLLNAVERFRLADEPGPDAARALAWDDQLRHFLADRPLPADFALGPLRWQLATFAWSFHVPDDPRRTAAEVPYDLADALSLNAPVRPNPLAVTYPSLADYARFLGRLPRR